jgi:hypothetical protein
MKKNEQREACNMFWKGNTGILNLAWMPEGNRTLRRPKHRYEDNIKVILISKVLVCCLIRLVQGTLSGHCWLIKTLLHEINMKTVPLTDMRLPQFKRRCFKTGSHTDLLELSTSQMKFL